MQGVNAGGDLCIQLPTATNVQNTRIQINSINGVNEISDLPQSSLHYLYTVLYGWTVDSGHLADTETAPRQHSAHMSILI